MNHQCHKNAEYKAPKNSPWYVNFHFSSLCGDRLGQALLQEPEEHSLAGSVHNEDLEGNASDVL